MHRQAPSQERQKPKANLSMAAVDADLMDVDPADHAGQHCKDDESASLTLSSSSSSADQRPEDTTANPVDKVKHCKPSQQNAVAFSIELLQLYYARLFPYDMLYEWLSYGNQRRVFSHREFSFTIAPTPEEEIYIRYQSFSSQNELSAAVSKRLPIKIDIGAIYSHPPKDKNTVTNYAPEARELVFDIDLTDYDDVRRCGCKRTDICRVCWEFMTMAVKVMDAGLREDFGFQHRAWFYSGRRGVHCWVCDESARALTDQGRSAVVHYFQVEMGTKMNKEMVLPNPLHPMLVRAYNVLEPMFIKNVLPRKGHGLLASDEQWMALLEDLPEVGSKVREMLTGIWRTKKSTPAEKWQELKDHLETFIRKSKPANKVAKTASSKEWNRLENWHVEVVFRYTYPRLDINVSKTRNHLLKSPFCVHPKTGRVCVPIRTNDIEQFNPFEVPTLPQLVHELDQAGNGEEGDKCRPDWYKTSLRKYFVPFQKDFLEPLGAVVRRKNRDETEKQAALVGDF